MQFKSHFFIAAGSVVVLGVAISGTANSSGQTGALVRLQSATPGTAQTGHANLTGTVIAGQFVGGGSGVTGLNAANLASGTLPSARLGGIYSNALTLNNAGNAFTGNGANLTNVNAALLGGLAPAAFAQIGGTNTWTAVNTFSNAGNSFTGSGTGLTALNASNLSSGTLLSARLSGTYSNALTLSNAANVFTGNGAALTNVNAAQLGGLTSAAFAQVGGTNTWTAVNTFSNAGNSFTGSGAGLTALNAANLSSGTLLSARLSGTYSNALTLSNAANVFTGNGAALTNVNATQLGGLAANQYGVLNNNNSWSGINGFSNPSNSFTGNGANLTNVNATTLDGIDSTAFLQAVPNPLILSGNSQSGLIQLNNTTNGIFSSAIAAYQTGNDEQSSVIYTQTDSTNGNSSAIEANNLGQGNGILAASVSGNGVRATSASATQAAIFAYNTSSGPALVANQKAIFNGNVSIGAGDSPVFPLDFPETLGGKISLWGTSLTSNYGLGVQSGQFQLYAATGSDVFSFGYGGSGAFTESVRIVNSAAELRFRPGGGASSSYMSTPYDFLIDHDFDNNSTDSWVRFFTNNFTVEQVRVQDGDEAATLFDGAVSANGIDFAEGFKVHDQTLEPGDLVINYGQDWEYVTRSQKAYDSAVIGVVSTKPAFIAGMSFNAEDRMDEELTKRRNAARAAGDQALEKLLTKQMREMVTRSYRPIAFMGRVPVKVTGPVRPGDQLTASNIPGTAMAMSRAGHSIGIALESNGEGPGKIMVMIQPRYFNGLEVPNNPNDRIQGLEATVKELKSENSELRARLDRLEQMLQKR